ncbi:hypothetical protein [Embleya sp. NPDC020886]|uniref:hypothetical protein n=1 Tax=Embleya sp. NPDC020886 TaxID=3363980 RepID=UPI0037B61A7B
MTPEPRNGSSGAWLIRVPISATALVIAVLAAANGSWGLSALMACTSALVAIRRP